MVHLRADAQVLSIAAYVRDIQHDLSRKLSLNPERILLNDRYLAVSLVKTLAVTHA